MAVGLIGVFALIPRNLFQYYGHIDDKLVADWIPAKQRAIKNPLSWGQALTCAMVAIGSHSMLDTFNIGKFPILYLYPFSVERVYWSYSFLPSIPLELSHEIFSLRSVWILAMEMVVVGGVLIILQLSISLLFVRRRFTTVSSRKGDS